MSNDYETTIIFDSALDDSAINAEVEKLSTLIQSHGGTVKRKQLAGRHRLAYMIKHKEFGVYVLLVHDGDNKLVSALERQLQINETVLRHLCVVKDKFAPDGDIIAIDDLSAVGMGEDLATGEDARDIADEAEVAA